MGKASVSDFTWRKKIGIWYQVTLVTEFLLSPISEIQWKG